MNIIQFTTPEERNLYDSGRIPTIEELKVKILNNVF